MSEEEKIKARERSRKYYQAHKEEILAKQYVYKKKKYKEDPEYRKKVYENSRRWIKKNPEKAYAIKRKWQVEHREPTKDEIIERLQQEIARSNKIIDDLETIFDTPYFDEEVSKQLGDNSFFTFKQMYKACNIVFKKRLQELKKEGKNKC